MDETPLITSSKAARSDTPRMVFPWDDSRRAFADAAEWFVRTAALVGDRWQRPGLGEWDVRALVGHTSRSLLTVEMYLARPAAAAGAAPPVHSPPPRPGGSPPRSPTTAPRERPPPTRLSRPADETPGSPSAPIPRPPWRRSPSACSRWWTPGTAPIS